MNRNPDFSSIASSRRWSPRHHQVLPVKPEGAAAVEDLEQVGPQAERLLKVQMGLHHELGGSLELAGARPRRASRVAKRPPAGSSVLLCILLVF